MSPAYSEAVYYIFLIVCAAMCTAALIIMIERFIDISPDKSSNDLYNQPLQKPTAPYKLEPGPRVAVGDVVRVVHGGAIFWGQVKRIDGHIYSVLVSSVEHIPEDLDPQCSVPDYGQTVHILDPHITYLFRSPVTVEA